MKTNKEFVKRIIETVQLKTLIILLKVQTSAKLTDKEKRCSKRSKWTNSRNIYWWRFKTNYIRAFIRK